MPPRAKRSTAPSIPHRNNHAADGRLNAAVERQDVLAVLQALGGGADPNLCAVNRIFYRLPILHRAVALGDVTIVEFLVAAGADLEAQGPERQTALGLASGRRATPMVRALLAAGANPRARALYGNQPLHLAAENGQAQNVAVLLAAGVEVDALNRDQRTPLDLAVEREAGAGTVRRLLAAGASPHRRARARHSMLHRVFLRTATAGGPTVVALLTAGAVLSPDDLEALSHPPYDHARRICQAVRTGQLPAATLLPLLNGPSAGLRTLAERQLPGVLRRVPASAITPFLATTHAKTRLIAIQALATAETGPQHGPVAVGEVAEQTGRRT